MATDKDLAWLREEINKTRASALGHEWSENPFVEKLETLRRIEAALTLEPLYAAPPAPSEVKP